MCADCRHLVVARHTPLRLADSMVLSDVLPANVRADGHKRRFTSLTISWGIQSNFARRRVDTPTAPGMLASSYREAFVS